MIEVRLAPTLRSYCGYESDLHIDARNVREALRILETEQGPLYRSVCDETGSVRQHIHFFVNSDHVLLKDPHGTETQLKSGDILTIWTAVSGG